MNFEFQSLQKIPIHAVFVLILIISANFLAQLFPCRMQKALNNNVYLKHFFGYLTLIFFVVLTIGLDSKNIFYISGISFLLYIWFILITKTTYAVMLFLLFLLFIAYIITLKIGELDQIINDEKTTKKDKDNAILTKDILKIIGSVIIIIIFIFTILGVVIYMGEKKFEYKGDFNYLTFFFGKAQCKNASPHIDLGKAFRYAFYSLKSLKNNKNNKF